MFWLDSFCFLNAFAGSANLSGGVVIMVRKLWFLTSFGLLLMCYVFVHIEMSAWKHLYEIPRKPVLYVLIICDGTFQCVLNIFPSISI